MAGTLAHVVSSLILIFHLESVQATMGLLQQRDVCCGNHSVPSDPSQLFPVLSLNLSDVNADVTCFHRVCAGAPTTFRLQYSGQSVPEVSVLADLCDVISSHGWSAAHPPDVIVTLTGRCLCLAVKIKPATEANSLGDNVIVNLGVTSWENQGQSNSTSFGYYCHVMDGNEEVESRKEGASSVTGWRVGLGVTLAMLLLLVFVAVLYHFCKRRTLPNFPDLKIRERLASCLRRIRRRRRGGSPEDDTQRRRPRNLRGLPISGPLPVIGLHPPQEELLQPPGQPHPPGQPEPWEYEDVALDNAAFSSGLETASENGSCIMGASCSNGVPHPTPPPPPPRPRPQLPLQAVGESHEGEREGGTAGGLSEGAEGTPRRKRRFLPSPPFGLLKVLKRGKRRPTSELQSQPEQEREHSRNSGDMRDVSNMADTPTSGQRGAGVVPHHDVMYDEPNSHLDYDDDDDFYDSEFDDVEGETEA